MIRRFPKVEMDQGWMRRLPPHLHPANLDACRATTTQSNHFPLLGHRACLNSRVATFGVQHEKLRLQSASFLSSCLKQAQAIRAMRGHSHAALALGSTS